MANAVLHLKRPDWALALAVQAVPGVENLENLDDQNLLLLSAGKHQSKAPGQEESFQMFCKSFGLLIVLSGTRV